MAWGCGVVHCLTRPSPQYCVCIDDCSSSNCMCGQLSMRCWYDKVSPRVSGGGAGGADWGPGRGQGGAYVPGWGAGARASLAEGSCGAGRVLLRQEPPDFGLGFRGHYWGQEWGVLG